MSKAIALFGLATILVLPGCAHIDFGDSKGLPYYDPKPYLFVSTTKECVSTATVVVIPDTQKYLKFITGVGSSDLSVSFSNGMIASVGQKSDTKIPETIGAIASVAAVAVTLAAPQARGGQARCPFAALYPINSGKPDMEQEIPVFGP